jgi:hypothetical protein
MTVATIFMNLIKFIITMLNMITGMFVMYDVTGTGYTVSELGFPIACILIFSFAIATLFLSVFMTVC